jgi:hypothetical protein
MREHAVVLPMSGDAQLTTMPLTDSESWLREQVGGEIVVFHRSVDVLGRHLSLAFVCNRQQRHEQEWYVRWAGELPSARPALPALMRHSVNVLATTFACEDAATNNGRAYLLGDVVVCTSTPDDEPEWAPMTHTDAQALLQLCWLIRGKQF